MRKKDLVGDSFPVPVFSVMLKNAGFEIREEALKSEMVRRALGVEVPMPTFHP